jgi:hypothetical protein
MKSSRQARELARRLGKLTEAQAALGWAVILLLAAVLGAIYLNQASRIATVGRRVQIEQSDLETFKRENNELERRIAEAQTLETLQQRAITLGFRPADGEEIEYLVIPNYPVATVEPPLERLPTASPSAAATPTPAIETMAQALWQALINGTQDLVRGESHEQ